MIKSNLLKLKKRKEENEKRILTYDIMRSELKDGVKVSSATLSRLFNPKNSFTRIDFDTLESLCKYFDATVGEIFEYVPET